MKKTRSELLVATIVPAVLFILSLTTLVIITRSVRVGDDAKMRCRYCTDGELHEGEDEGLVERSSASTTQGIIDENEIKNVAL